MDYILCRNKNIRSKEWQKCTGDNGIDTDVIRECFEGEEGKTLLREDIKMAKGLGISASPTWLVNNKYKFQGIDAETVRKNLCKHNEDLNNCDKKLSGPPKRKRGGGGACK
jgi:predicted DsbA family dithiol-disulfide isomerase